MSEFDQSQFERELKSLSPETDQELTALEEEKLQDLEEPTRRSFARIREALQGVTISSEEQRTSDFTEKHGGHIRKREKRHTGRDQHPQHERQRVQKEETALARERHYNATLHEDILQGVLDYRYGETPLPGELEEVLDIDAIRREFKKLFDFVDTRPSEPHLVEKYQDTNDRIERLKLLTRMSLTDAIVAIIGSDAPGTQYLLKKLSFYRDFIEGKAVVKKQQYDYSTGQYVWEEQSLSADDARPENIATGLRRNILYAAMKGSPELAAFNIALRRVKDRQSSSSDRRYSASTEHMPDLFGFHSGIFNGSHSIGAYPVLREIYKEAYQEITHSLGPEELATTPPSILEHEAVMLAARWYTKAMEYNDPGRTQHSPYSSMERNKSQGLRESIAWARLGESVQRQLRGMRQKIQGVDLHNIGRFIGKAGDDKYGRELRQIHGELEHIPWDSQQEWVSTRNSRDIARLNTRHRKEQEAVMFRLERKKDEIDALELPEEERALQLQNLTSRYEKELERLQQEYTSELQRLQARTPGQLIEELKTRQEALKEKHERHKSLAQKAIDLHFAFQPERDDNGYYIGQQLNVIDWINYAPLGTISRAHTALQRGVSKETVVAMSVTDMVLGGSEINRANLDRIRRIMAEAQQRGEIYRLSNLVRVGSMLRQNGVEAPLAVIEAMASKNYQGLHKALKEFSLDEIQDALNKGLNLYVLTALRKSLRERGYELTIVALESLARSVQNYRDDELSEWLGRSLDRFGLDDTRLIINSGTALESAIQIDEIATGYGHHLLMADIISIAGYIDYETGLESFSDSLKNLSLPEARQLLTCKVSYSRYSEISTLLDEYQIQKDFTETVQLARSVEGHELAQALEVFSMLEIEQIVKSGARLANAVEVRWIVEEKSIAYTFDQLVMLSQQGSWYVNNALTRFGLEATLYLIRDGVELYAALNVVSSNTLKRLGIPEKPEIIAIMARHRSGEELAEKVFRAGFKVEEIIQYPFLLSSLITKMEG